jgi:hypothetical protein
LRQEVALLKQLADKYARDSREYLAVEHAALALSFAVTKNHEQFSDFVRECAEDLTDEQKAYLAKLGLR